MAGASRSPNNDIENQNRKRPVDSPSKAGRHSSKKKKKAATTRAPEEPFTRRRLDDGHCMSCRKVYEHQGELDGISRLPMAPCRGCGYQICLPCVRRQQLLDPSYRGNQRLATYVKCTTPGCKETQSFHAVKPILNELACLLMQQLEQVKRERDRFRKERDALRGERDAILLLHNSNNQTQEIAIKHEREEEVAPAAATSFGHDDAVTESADNAA